MKQSSKEAAVQAIGGFAAANSVLTATATTSVRAIVSVFIASILSLSSISAHANGWDSLNDPSNMDTGGRYDYNLDHLPTEGELYTKPWSETYWPTNKGSINIRWNTPDRDGFNYNPPSLDELRAMSSQQLAELSPAEKYDIYMGRYDYPLWYKATGWRDRTAPDWYGICDGWSYAAISYAEPTPVTVRNRDGIDIPFGSSDIKGLMSFAAASGDLKDINPANKMKTVNSYQVGIKCEAAHGPGCDDDMNAGAMHIIVTNQIGLLHQGFVTERDPGPEVWNQPTYGYRVQLLGSARSRYADHGVQVHMTLYYTDELDASEWEPVVNTSRFQFNKLEMDYILDLDGDNNIVGGTWMAGSDHPDYMWLPSEQLSFRGYYAGINSLIHGGPIPGPAPGPYPHPNPNPNPNPYPQPPRPSPTPSHDDDCPWWWPFCK